MSEHTKERSVPKSEKLCAAFIAACDVLNALGLAPFPDHINADGLVSGKIIGVGCGEWTITANPGKVECNGIPPYHVVVDWNGWVAGVLNAYGGQFAAGEVANEDAFLAATKAMLDGQPEEVPL